MSGNMWACKTCNREMRLSPCSDSKHQLVHEQHLIYRRQMYSTLRITSMEKLGGAVCVKCRMTDVRVLQINHLLGNGAVEVLSSTKFLRDIISGRRSIDDLEVRCANCNILYEYERGYRHSYSPEMGLTVGKISPNLKVVGRCK